MAERGYLVKFNGKKAVRCYAVAFDYDEGWYKVNNDKPKKLPNVKKISIEIEKRSHDGTQKIRRT